jgi:ABC-type Fe3+-hydroxamate transport system substrate-binding protein
MMKYLRVSILFLLVLSLLSACSGASFKEESKKTEKAVEAALNEKIKSPNKKVQSIQFYLPFGYEIKKETPNNIILKNGSKTYILFYNPQETSESEIVYKASVEQHEKLEINKNFKKDKKFAYLLIDKLEEKKNEVTVGIGGRKMTTEAKTSNMENEAKIMMEIVNSVKRK